MSMSCAGAASFSLENFEVPLMSEIKKSACKKQIPEIAINQISHIYNDIGIYFRHILRVFDVIQTLVVS